MRHVTGMKIVIGAVYGSRCCRHAGLFLLLFSFFVAPVTTMVALVALFFRGVRQRMRRPDTLHPHPISHHRIAPHAHRQRGSMSDAQAQEHA